MVLILIVWMIIIVYHLFIYSAINGNSEITKILIEYGANVNQVDDENLSALHYAYKNNNKRYQYFVGK